MPCECVQAEALGVGVVVEFGEEVEEDAKRSRELSRMV